MSFFSGLFRRKKDNGSQVSDNKSQAIVGSVEQLAVTANDKATDIPIQTSKSSSVKKIEGINLSQEQSNVVDLLENSNDSFFVTGKAGTGKSVVLRYFVANTKKNVVVLAPTGIAALNVKGQTIHSFFGMETAVQNPYDSISLHKNLSLKRIAIMKSLDAIVIDEISMVRADVLDMIDAKMKVARENGQPFGGCQMIFFGDLFQLPPVDEKDKKSQAYIHDTYHTIFFFGAPACRVKPPRIIELTNVFRQNDQEFIDALNAFRIGNANEKHIDNINMRVGESKPSSGIITLVATNAVANRINQENLAKLTLPEFEYFGEITGNFPVADYPTDLIMKLRVGAQIMMLKNDPNKNWVNGTLGIVSYLSNELIKIKIHNREYSIDKETWSRYEYDYDPVQQKLQKKEVGSFKQFPIRLAYAITIHKSQGQTYDAAIVDYSEARAFTAGQTYVALSRCKTLERLYLTDPIQPSDIKVNQEVLDYMNNRLTLPDIKQRSLPPAPEKKTTPISKNTDGSYSIIGEVKPKKISGTRLPGVLGLNRFSSPFKTWCDIMRVWSDFEENKYTRAGEAIEPKQFAYAKNVLSAPGRSFVSPKDMYGDDPKGATGYDFFSDTEVFGGMWDYLMVENNRITAVLEMKTKNNKYQNAYAKEYPKDLIVQASLYAYLLGVKTVYMVTSYLAESDYDSPQDYQCSSRNTEIKKVDVSMYFGDFETKYIKQAKQWWEKYVSSGVSPIPTAQDLNDLDKKWKPVIRVLQCPSCKSSSVHRDGEQYICDHCRTRFWME